MPDRTGPTKTSNGNPAYSYRHSRRTAECRPGYKKYTVLKREFRFATAAKVYKKLINRKSYITFAAVAVLLITALLSSLLAYKGVDGQKDGAPREDGHPSPH